MKGRMAGRPNAPVLASLESPRGRSECRIRDLWLRCGSLRSTVTDSASPASFRTTVRSIIAPTPMRTSSSKGANPCIPMSSTYSLGGRAGKRSCPFSFVVNVVRPAISTEELRRMTAPEGRRPGRPRTVPMRVPVNSCAAAIGGSSTEAAARLRRIRLGGWPLSLDHTASPLVFASQNRTSLSLPVRALHAVLHSVAWRRVIAASRSINDSSIRTVRAKPLDNRTPRRRKPR